MSHDNHMTLKEQWYQAANTVDLRKGFLLSRSPNCDELSGSMLIFETANITDNI